MTSIPVYKILSVSYAYSGENARAEVPRLAEYIAIDLMTVYLDTMLSEVFRGRPEVEFAQAGDEYERWRTQIRQTQIHLRDLREEVAEPG